MDAATDDNIRTSALRYASALTVDRADPAAVIENCRPLLTWLAQAETRRELGLRFAALQQQHANSSSVDADDDPYRLIAAANELLHGVLETSCDETAELSPAGA